jgi:hypothetical protein
MMPSIELRLQTMAKAMAEVILPAIAPENALAREQAQLMIAQLGMVANHWRRAAEYDALGLREIAALAERLCAVATGGIDGDEAFEQASSEAILEYSALEAWRGRVWFAGCGMDPERARLPEIDDMLAKTTRVALRERETP